MPPSRRRGSNTAARSNQATLSFGSQSQVTKSSAAPPAHAQKVKDLEPVTVALSKKPSLESVSEAEQSPVTPIDVSHPHVAELAVRQQAQAEIQQPLSEEDRKAKKLTEKDIQRYWKNEEAKRRGPLGIVFLQYGPCIGIARVKRWRRANSLNLNPPIEVLGVLLKDNDEKAQRAYVDELMS
ncbi:hypothetical protein FE257_011703 [Aspergillus nanangensis]|uniref:DNA polymerase delta subunit 4 n=1 Tax=Aspergillus nanangensis TaxID=2582783 RepID=A0AAD4CVJ5_ASPNN|nr:hypothetical protein FE257_011703 [Aspergillus nanangensis]